jgi:hypothetical protein
MAQYARPNNDPTQTTNWAPSTGSDLYAMIDEASPNDADYISVDDNGGGTETCQVDLSSVTDPVASSLHVVTVRASESSGMSVISLAVTLKQGAATIASNTFAAIAGSATNYTFTLSSVQADSITNYGALSLVFAATDSMSMMTTTTIYQAFFECGDAPVPTGIAGIAYSPARAAASGAAYGATQRIR